MQTKKQNDTGAPPDIRRTEFVIAETPVRPIDGTHLLARGMALALRDLGDQSARDDDAAMVIVTARLQDCANRIGNRDKPGDDVAAALLRHFAMWLASELQKPDRRKPLQS